MSRRPTVRVAIGPAAACALALLLPSHARAQDVQQTPDLAEAPANAAEQAALDALRSGRFVRGRELAEAVLRVNPGSVPAQYVLGMALHEAEGNTPLALRHFQQALARVSVESGRPRPGAAGWHARLLVATMVALSDLGRHDELLALQRVYRDVYNPQAYARDVWPLMKLGRVDEARAAARRALASGDPIEEVIARNGLCALDGYPACVEMLAAVRKAQLDPGLALRNVGVAAQEAGRYAESERLLLESTGYPEESANPWRDLAALYVTQARFGEALDAARRMIAFSRRLPPRYRQHGGAEDLVAAGQLLLVVGHAERAAAATGRALAAPDRAAHWSGSPLEILAEGQLLDRAVQRSLAEEQREAAALAGWLEAPAHHWQAATHGMAAWLSGRRLQPLLQAGGLRPHDPALPLRPELSAPGWLLPDAVALFGPGPTLALLDEVRSRGPSPEDTIPPELREALLLALESEARWLRGDPRGCLDAGRRARALLPAAEVLLRARIALRMAQSASRLDEPATAWALLDEVLARDPGALRRLGVRLPVRLAAGGPTPVARAARRALSTPRFTRDDGSPFALAAQGERLCLLGPNGAQLACAEDPGPRPAIRPGPPWDAPEQREGNARLDPRDLDDPAARIAAQLLRTAFAPRVDLSQQDLSTLDGTPIAERGLDATGLEQLIK